MGGSIDCSNAMRLEGNNEVDALKALSEHSPCASLALSRLYYNSSDFKLALSYATVAALEGYKVAQYELALLLLLEEADFRDPALAMDWLRKSASQDYVLAQSLLARLLLEGKVADKNVSEGLQWLDRAYKNGSAEAYLMIERITQIE